MYEGFVPSFLERGMTDLKLEVPPDDMRLTLQYAITRRVQWRRTSIDVDPSIVASASTTTSQPNTAPTSIFPKTCLSSSPIRELSCPSLISDGVSPSPIREQSRSSPPQTRSTPLPAPDQMRPLLPCQR
jgi:hypothetical protein